MIKNNDYKPALQLYNYGIEDKNLKSSMIFENLIWLTTKETAVYLRKSVNSIHILVSRGQLRARKYRNRLYFKKNELDYMIETSKFIGG